MPVSRELTLRQVGRFYYPLAANATLMMVETPLVIAGVSRLPNAELELAAYGVMTALTWWLVNIGTPLVHTGNALGRTRAAFSLLRNFALGVSVFATALAAAIYFTPAYGGMVEGLLGANPVVAAAAHPGTQLMLATSFAIGYRRFYQGVLIRHGYTGLVGWLTLSRALTVGAMVWAGVSWGQWSGATLAAAAMAGSTSVECVLVCIFAESVLRGKNGPRWEPEGSLRLSYLSALRFYLPLALVMLLNGTARPIITAALTRLPEPVISLAAFPVAYGVFNVIYSPLYPLIQTVIALVRDGHSYRVVVRFTRAVCVLGWVVLMMATLTPAAEYYLTAVLGVPEQVRVAALPAVQVFSFYLLLMAFHNVYQGLLVAARRTLETQFASIANVATIALVLATGVAWGGAAGVVVGAAAFVAGFSAEAALLAWRATGMRRDFAADDATEQRLPDVGSKHASG
ncbi:MAG: hypothetical protein ACYC4L_00555 [Chloroflexota bacterium]